MATFLLKIGDVKNDDRFKIILPFIPEASSPRTSFDYIVIYCSMFSFLVDGLCRSFDYVREIMVTFVSLLFCIDIFI